MMRVLVSHSANHITHKSSATMSNQGFFLPGPWNREKQRYMGSQADEVISRVASAGGRVAGIKDT